MIFGYFRVFKNTHKSPNQGTWLGNPWLGLVSLCQIFDLYRYSLNTLKYPIMGICFFSCDMNTFCECILKKMGPTHAHFQNNARKLMMLNSVLLFATSGL